tara:strand:+ start:113916 stop:114263 length:348 start_codon:yes stop_codon:yes gene_type:complete
MDNDNDEMNDVYAGSAMGQYIEPAETPNETIGSVDGEGVLDTYFSRGGKTPSGNPAPEPQTQPQAQQQVVEGVATNPQMFLTEAIANIYKAYPHMKNPKDQEYLKEIKEAIEELI